VIKEQQELPGDWDWSSFAEVTVYIQRGKSPKYIDYSELPVVNQKCVRWEGIDRTFLKYIHPDQFEKWEEKRFLQNGDILWNSTGTGTIGRACLVQLKNDERLVVDSHVTLIRHSENLEAKFLHYWIMSPVIQNNIEGMQSGSTNQVELSKKAIESTSVPVAPLEQQKQIVAKIEELFSHIDAGIEGLKKSKALLKQYRQSVLKAAVTGELTKDWRAENANKIEPAEQLWKQINIARDEWISLEIPKGNSEAKRLKAKIKKNEFKPLVELPESWISISLLQLCLLVVDCHNKTAPYVGEGIPLIRTSNIKNGQINFLEKMKYVNQETYEYWSRRCPPMPGDILFTREAPMGESAIIPTGYTVCMGQRMMLLRVIHELTNVKYLHIALLDPQFQDRFQDFKVGMGVQHLRVGDVEKSVVALPSLVEQNEIVQRVEEKLTAADRLMAELDTKLTQAQQQKKTILASAFKGELI